MEYNDDNVLETSSDVSALAEYAVKALKECPYPKDEILEDWGSLPTEEETAIVMPLTIADLCENGLLAEFQAEAILELSGQLLRAIVRNRVSAQKKETN